MRYFVYKDSQILGPFAREELDQAGGLRPETLVCEEGAPGKRDLDWQALERVAELAGVATLPPAVLGVLDTPLESASSVLERLELESLGVPTDESEPGWLRDLFDDAEFKERWGLTLKPAAGAEVPEEQRKVAEMSVQLKALQARIAELEAEQSRLLNKPAPAAPSAPHAFKSAGPAKTFGPAQSSSTAPATPFDAPPPAEAPAQAPPAEDPFAAPAAGAEAPAPETAAGPAPRFALKPQEAPAGLEIRFGAKRSFKTAPKPASQEAAPAPAALPPMPGFGAPAFGAPPAAAAPAPAALPPMPSFAPPPAPAAAAPAAQAPPTVPPTVMPALTPAPAPAALPPMPSLTPAPAPSASAPLDATAPPSTMRFTVQPPPAGTMGGGVPPLEPPPIPTNLGGGATLVPPAPATLMPGSGAAAAAAAVPISPLPPAPQTQDVLARLAKPSPAPETAPPKPRGANKKLFIALGVAVVLLGGVLFFFLRSPRDLKTMANMGADQRPIGMPADDHQAQPPVFQQQQAAPQAFPPAAPQAAPAAAPPAPQAAAPVTPPAAGADDAAIALVKDYPLDGDRGTVAQWLQFQFQANPDDANQEQWTAGAVDATTYLVQYQLKPGPKSAIKESVNYVFEADVQRQTVLGKNPAARQLLAGGAPAKPKKAAKPKSKKPSKPKARRPAQPTVPKEVPLAPLPSDAELLPPADNDSGFSNDTINPPL